MHLRGLQANVAKMALVRASRPSSGLSAVSAARTLAIACLYPLVGLLLDRSLPLAFVAVAALGLAAASLAAAPARLFEEAAESSAA